MERGNIKTSPSCITRDVTVWENIIKSRRKHVQPMHRITEQQRLRQVQFAKDAKRWAKKRGLTGKEVKDLKAFIKDKIKETIKERNCNMHTISDYKDLSISLSNGGIKSIINYISVEDLDNDSCKPAHKK
eukprot:15234199-Ditylum_brightwellii.AAC.1